MPAAAAIEPAAAGAPMGAGMGGAGMGGGYSLYEVVKVAAGAVVGGWAGNWLYTNSK